jgi:hypothetical protein
MIERQDRARERATHEHVINAEERAAQVAELRLERGNVDARRRDVGTEPINEENHEREKDFLLQLRNLPQVADWVVRHELSLPGALRSRPLPRPWRAPTR